MLADHETRRVLDQSFLGDLPREVNVALLANGDRADYPPGSTIYREGDPPRTLLVLRGLLRVYMSSPEGRQVTVRYARTADVLGVAALVGGPADVERADPRGRQRAPPRRTAAAGRGAAGRSGLVGSGRGAEPALVREPPADGRQRVRVGAPASGDASPRPRVDAAAPRGTLVANVKQQELADAIGSTREVVARVLRDLRLEGLVATGPDSIHLLDPTGLQAERWSGAGGL